MGLLSKALEKKNSWELAELAKPIRDRILRIKPGADIPYTALSLLKVYGSFKVGACFSLEGQTYISYTSVGLGVKKISIPAYILFNPESSSKKYFKFDREDKTGIAFLDGEYELWCFPLDKEEPWNVIIIIEPAGLPSFSPLVISIVLDAVKNIIYVRRNKTESDLQNAKG
ncbi:MAG: hypothetical protein LBI14_08220 [Treponema sp.]|jgi:hypothetical protein|nr:hypothetical protein [Treponema sp.]